MSWYKDNETDGKIICQQTIRFNNPIDNKVVKLASYRSKKHDTAFAVQDDNDGYQCKMQITESKNKITIVARFLSDVYRYPLFEDMWHYKSGNGKKAFKTFNRIINVIEDLKIEMEDGEVPGPTLQGKAREELRYIDVENKVDTRNRSLEAAKFLDGESDWRSTIYGPRYPERGINISNFGTLNIDGNAR